MCKKGYKQSEEHKRKIGKSNSISLKGKKPWNYSEKRVCCNCGSIIENKKQRTVCKECKKKYDKNYYTKNKTKKLLKIKEYLNTPQGKQTKSKVSHRRRGLGYIPLNNYFEGCEAHHITSKFIIHIPLELHKSISHRLDEKESMKKINFLAFKYLMENL